MRGLGQSVAGVCGLFLAGIGTVQISTASASADEVCRFTGTTDYAGHVGVTTDVTTNGGVTRVAVAVTFSATTMLFFHYHYLVEEISSWRAGALESVAVNNRSFVGDHIVRQQWDEFQRGADGLQARRVQAKTLADFRLKHLGFVQHWDPETFGWPWLQDYQSASPERRPDLDLKGAPLPPGLRTPLAMAFYWIRWLPRDGQDVPVFLPGFKSDLIVELPITAASWPGGMMWQTPLRYSALSKRPLSTATAWMSPDHHLLQLAFDLHGPRGSARGQIHQEGCEGAPVVPAPLP